MSVMDLNRSDAMQGLRKAQESGQQMLSSVLQNTLPHSTAANVSDNERLVSLAAGSVLTMLGIGRRDLTGLLIAGVGGSMIYRGATGQCSLYKALNINTATSESSEAGRTSTIKKYGTHVDQSFTINKSPEELYQFWRNFENLPKFMSHLKSVTVTEEGRSHWVTEAPSLVGGQVEWDAEISADEPNRRIAWQSLEGADVTHSGSVSFTAAPADRGTTVRVVMDYLPPGGQLGRMIAKLFGESAEQQIREDLRTFKRIMETGEAPTTDGQSHGSCLGRSK